MKNRLRNRLPGSLRTRSGTYRPLASTRTPYATIRRTAIPMVTSRDRLHLVFTHPTRLGRGRTLAYPVVRTAQVSYLRQFCNESEVALPARDNQYDRQPHAQATDGILGRLVLDRQRRFRAAVEVQRVQDPDLLREPSGHIAPDRGPLRGEDEDLAVLELGDGGRARRFGAIVRPGARWSAAAHQRREALHRLHPLLGVEVAGGNEPGRLRFGLAAHQSGRSGVGRRPRDGGEEERVLPLASRAPHPFAVRDQLAGGADVGAVPRIEGPVHDDQGGRVAPPPFPKGRPGRVVPDQEARLGGIDQHDARRPGCV